VSECRGTRHPSGDGLTNHSSSNLLRSRSSQSLRQTPDMSGSVPNDDRLTVLVQMFWISVSLLESDFEYEFLLAVRLLDKVCLSVCLSVSLKLYQTVGFAKKRPDTRFIRARAEVWCIAAVRQNTNTVFCLLFGPNRMK